ncbi:cell envelope integrity protein CreD [Pseudomonadota bacterium]
MNRAFAIKLGTIAFLILILMLALSMIGDLIEERQAQREYVIQDIARSSSYNQKITGPLLVVPYKKKIRNWQINSKTHERIAVESEIDGRLYFLPEKFVLNGTVLTELRTRGIYEANLYHANSKISGHFELPENLGIEDHVEHYQFDAPYLAMGISDIRGIGNALKLNINGETISFKPGSLVSLLGSGVHAPLKAMDNAEPRTLAFEFDLKLQGTGQLDVTPVGRESEVILKSDWPHPSFVGEYLPAKHEITDNGFSAHWSTSYFSTNMKEALNECTSELRCDSFRSRHFGVNLINPVDQYLKSERAIKYALLFIALTFAGFFLFEVLKSMAVHPVQYGLVGLALAFFYMLLLSLSEHIGFTLAYLLSSTACVSLIGFYVSFVLGSFVRGGGFAAGLTALYAMLFALLNSEDYALLMGSILLFGLLGVVMVLTRKLDWYSVGATNQSA